MSIGSDDIANSITTETILLNKSLKLEYDVHQKPQGKDAKKYLTIKVDQFVKKQVKKDLTTAMMSGLNDLAGKRDENTPDPIFPEIEVGDSCQDTKQVQHTLGQLSDNGKQIAKLDKGLKILREIAQKDIFSKDKEAKLNLRKLNYLRGVVE